MKKIRFFIVLSCFALLLLSYSCYSVNKGKAYSYNNQYSPNIGKSIPFKYFFRGFITLREKQINSYPHSTYIITNRNDWGRFMGKYMPGIPYDVSVDFSRENLLFCVLFSPKPFYSIGVNIKNIKVIDSSLEPNYEVKGTTGISNGIYAQNIEGIMHCFVNIVKINKKDLPVKIKNIYH